MEDRYMRDKIIVITCFSTLVKSCIFIVYTYILQKRHSNLFIIFKAVVHSLISIESIQND